MRNNLRKDIVKKLELLGKNKKYSDTIDNLMFSNQKKHLEILRLIRKSKSKKQNEK